MNHQSPKPGLPAVPDNPLAATEMSAEGNYNMIDGVINNEAPRRADLTDGQSYDEIMELAPETLPDVERPSVLDAIQKMREELNASGPGAEHPDFDLEL